jgi:hypothetical protein
MTDSEDTAEINDGQRAVVQDAISPLLTRDVIPPPNDARHDMTPL